ncbi:TPA: fimbria/pilus outer membrane usher protein [Photobacterium damselae]
MKNKSLILTIIIISNKVFCFEFNEDFIKLNSNTREKSELSKNLYDYGKPKIGTEGYYQTYINKKYVGEIPVKFIEGALNTTIIDFNEMFLKSLENYGVNLDRNAIINDTKKNNKFGDRKNVFYKLEFWNNSLYINIPDKYINIDDNNIFDLKRVTEGQSGGFVSYDFNTRVDLDKLHNNSSYGNFNIGINYKDIAFRGRLSNQFNTGDISIDDFYITKSFIDTRSNLSIGKLNTDSEYRSGSIEFFGVKISTDLRMYSYDESSYHHRIIGDVSEPSIINIYFHNKLIYTKQVGAGEYIIKELPSLGNGELIIEEIGDSGKLITRKEYISSLSSLFNSGISSYEISTGKTSGEHNIPFVNLNYKKGFDTYTLSGSQVLSNDYLSTYLKSTFSLGGYGAIEIDGSYSNSKIKSKWKDGGRLGILYSNSIYDVFDFQLSGYHFSTENYFDFQDFISYSDDSNINKLKEQYISRLGINSTLGDLYISYLENIYWGNDIHQTDLSLSYSNNISIFDYSINFIRTKNNYSNNNGFNINISVPIGMNHNVNSYFNSSDGIDSYGVNYSSDFNDNLSYSLSTNKVGKQYSTSINANYNNTNTRFRANLSRDSKRTNLTVGASGTMLYLDNEIDFTEQRGNSFVKIKTVSDNIRVNGVKTNDNGNLIMSNLIPFRENKFRVDPNSLDKNEIMKKPEIIIFPDSNSLNSVDADVKKVKFKKVTFSKNGKLYPIGTKVIIDSNKYLLDNNSSTLALIDENISNIEYSIKNCNGIIEISDNNKEVVDVSC